MCPSIHVTEKASHAYKTPGKTAVCNVLFFTQQTWSRFSCPHGAYTGRVLVRCRPVLLGEGGHTRPSSPLDRVYKPSGLLQTASVHLNFLPREHIAGASAPGTNTVNDESIGGKWVLYCWKERSLQKQAGHNAVVMNEIYTFKLNFISIKSKIYARRNSFNASSQFCFIISESLKTHGISVLCIKCVFRVYLKLLFEALLVPVHIERVTLEMQKCHLCRILIKFVMRLQILVKRISWKSI